MTLEAAIEAFLALLAGAGGGLVFFRLLALNTRLYAAGKAGQATSLHLGRLAVTALLFIATARLGGALPLIALLAGFLAVRPLLMRRYGRA